jgi:type IV pilus assembly protein PilV
MTNTARSRSRGVTMIEVLVTLVILMVGLLGIAGLSIRANSAEMESYQRVQALVLLNDMVDRLNANRKVASCYSNGANGVTLGSGATLPACTSGSASQNAQTAADLQAWNDMLAGQAETEVVGGKTVTRGAMIGAVGCITQEASPPAAPNSYLITVSWRGLASTSAPTLADGTPAPCGNGLYGDETLHRIVTAKVRIGDLAGFGVLTP